MLVVASCFLMACNHVPSPNESNIETTDSIYTFAEYQESTYSVPSPHIAGIELKKNGCSFKQELLNPYKQYQNYTSTIKQALNLGVYGTDLGYSALLHQPMVCFPYMESIKKLSSELNLLENIDPELVDGFKNFDDELNEPEDLLRSVSLIFQESDAYLKRSQRSEIGAFILAGGWIESMYLVAREYQETQSPQIFTFIAQQQPALDNLISVLSPYADQNDEMNQWIADFINLAYDYEIIGIKQQVENIQIKKGIIEINNQYEATNDTRSLDSIISKIIRIRTKVVS